VSNGWTGGQYSVVRAILGALLCVQFLRTIRWSAEGVSRVALLPDARSSPLARLLPNVLDVWNSPTAALVLLGVGATLWFAWVGGTAVGALLGQAIGDPSAFGLDGAFTALFVALLAAQLRDRRRVAAAVLGVAIAASLTPFVPAGVPIVAATAAVLVGWRRS